jgi:hypothetical protein
VTRSLVPEAAPERSSTRSGGDQNTGYGSQFVAVSPAGETSCKRTGEPSGLGLRKAPEADGVDVPDGSSPAPGADRLSLGIPGELIPLSIVFWVNCSAIGQELNQCVYGYRVGTAQPSPSNAVYGNSDSPSGFLMGLVAADSAGSTTATFSATKRAQAKATGKRPLFWTTCQPNSSAPIRTQTPDSPELVFAAA